MLTKSEKIIIIVLITLLVLSLIWAVYYNDIANIIRLLETGDFTGGIFGLSEDSWQITLLIGIAHLLGNSVAIY